MELKHVLMLSKSNWQYKNLTRKRETLNQNFLMAEQNAIWIRNND